MANEQFWGYHSQFLFSLPLPPSILCHICDGNPKWPLCFYSKRESAVWYVKETGRQRGKECRGAWEWERWRAECLHLPTVINSPQAPYMTSCSHFASNWATSKNVYLLACFIVVLTKDPCLFAWKPLCVCVCACESVSVWSGKDEGASESVLEREWGSSKGLCAGREAGTGSQAPVLWCSKGDW